MSDTWTGVQAPPRAVETPRAANARAMPRSDLKGKRVRLYSRPDNDLTYRFPLIVEAFSNLRLRSCIMDGEAVSCGPDGIASWIVGHPVENDELGHCISS